MASSVTRSDISGPWVLISGAVAIGYGSLCLLLLVVLGWALKYLCAAAGHVEGCAVGCCCVLCECCWAEFAGQAALWGQYLTM